VSGRGRATRYNGPVLVGRLPRPGRPGPALVAGLVAVGLTILAGCGGDGDAPADASADASAATTSTAPALPPVTRPPDGAAPGTLIEATPIDAPAGARAWRIVFHSRSAGDADIAVTGLLVAPDSAAGSPAGGPAPVVAWGHSTTGTADACAPSARGVAELPVADAATAEGWAVVAPDFEGLGVEGPHPYLVGASAGHTMLDALRAAAQVDGSGVAASSPALLWGFSQGGQAALFAAEQAPSYAPEIDLRGVAAVAPVGDARRFWDRAAERPDQVGVAVVMAHGLHAAQPELEVSEVLTDDAIAQLDRLEVECIGEVVERFAGPVDDVLRGPVDEAPAWAAALDANRAGTRPSGLAALVVQGDADDIVYPAIGDELAQRLCAHGDPVEYVVAAGAGHGDIPPEQVIPWLADRLAGRPAPSSCPVPG
jgi:hypothetical protein